MADKLRGKRVAFLATDMVEQVELTEPWQALVDEGAEVELATGAGSLRLMTSGSSELGASWSVLQAARAAVSAISGKAR